MATVTVFRTDKPLPARAQGAPIRPSIENFTRLETFGTPNHHWVEVSVDPNDPNVFSVRQKDRSNQPRQECE
jgi:hypothetical protein